MHKSKLIQTLQAFNSQELELLKKWIYSPVGCQHPETQKLLLNLISKRKLSDKTANKNLVFRQLYPQKPYDDSKLRTLMNRSLQVLENFVHFSLQKKDAFSKNKALVNFYQSRQLPKYAQQYIQKAQKLQKQQFSQDSQYYYQQYQLEQEIFDQKGTATRMRQTNLQTIFDHHYIAFALETLRHACTAITHQNLYNSRYKIPLLEQLLNDISHNIAYKDIPAIQLYYHSYMALSYPEKEKHFEELKKLLIHQHNILSESETKSIYVIAINYCVRRLNTGSEHYVQAVFELYEHGLDSSILIEKNILSRFTYKNIVAIALRLKEHQWVDRFIQKYTSYLELDYQENYGYYAKAKLLFSQDDFDATLQLLAQVEFDDIFLNMDAKLMLLKIYYERQYFDSLDALITSFRRFLQRKETIAYLKAIYENIINLTEKLIKLTPDKASKLALQEEINTTTPLTERPWLLAQLHKLK
ncbi:MAG: hypothetical protein GY810_16445 [Aureispira sp.]|nr:hypothetical protein [Aureispira sp.]